MLERTTVKHELHELIESLDEEQAEWLLDYVNNMLDGDEATPEELEAHARGMAQIRAGESISLEDLERELGL